MDPLWIIIPAVVLYVVGVAVSLWLRWDDIVSPEPFNEMMPDESDTGPAGEIAASIFWPIVLVFAILIIGIVVIGALGEGVQKKKGSTPPVNQ
jgi:hypothetical protein